MRRIEQNGFFSASDLFTFAVRSKIYITSFLIYANRALIHLYGCETLKEFLAHTGGTFPGMIHPEDRQATADSIREQIAVSCDNPDYVEYRIVRKDGSVRWVDDYGHFVHTKAFGDVFYVFLVDATEKYLRQLIDEKYAQLGKERRDALERLNFLYQ